MCAQERQFTPNKNITRLIKCVTSTDVSIQQLVRRVESIGVISLLLYLLKLRRSIKPVLAAEWVRNSGAVMALFVISPVLNKILSKCRHFHSSLIPYSASIGTSLALMQSVPSWVVSYMIVEPTNDYLQASKVVGSSIQAAPADALYVYRQAIFCLMLPIIHLKLGTVKKLAGGANFLFGKRSLKQDFVWFLAIWDFLSIFEIIKRTLHNKKGQITNVSRLRCHPLVNKFNIEDRWALSANLKPMLDKVNEINELAFHDKSSILEKIMSSFIVSNIVPCVKWALWRQLVLYLFHKRRKAGINLHTSCTSLMKATIAFLGFFVLDTQGDMNIRPGVIRCFLRSVLGDQLECCTMKEKRLLLFIGSQLAFCNHQKSIRR